MVSFSCEACNDTLVKKKLDNHKNQCRNAQFTCLDCNVTFQGTDYRAHTSCISEAQKYQGKLYRGEKGQRGNSQQNGRNGQQQQQQQRPNRAATGANGAMQGQPRILFQGNGSVKAAGEEEKKEDVEMGEAPAVIGTTNGEKKEDVKAEEKKEKKEKKDKKDKKDKKRKRDGEEEKDGKKAKSDDSESSSKDFKKLVKLAPKEGKKDMTFTEFLVEVKKDAALFAVFQELKVRRGEDGLVLFQ